MVRERWPWEHVRFALVGLGAWYLTYAAFRNLKSFVPFVNRDLWDDTLADLDRIVFLGHDPATVLHAVFGVGWAAQFFSFVYVAWIVFVPVSLVVALVWSRDRAGGVVVRHRRRRRLGARRRDVLRGADARPGLRPAAGLRRRCPTPTSPRSRTR